MKNKILKNSLLGGLLFALFTYFIEIFEKHPNYLKISAFLWAAPLFFLFLIIYFPSQKNNQVLKCFTLNALLGTLLSISIFIITYLMIDINNYIIFIVNLFITVCIIYLYLLNMYY